MRAGKSNFTEPIIFGTIVAVLLGMRVYWSWAGSKPKAVQASGG
jgi:sulfoxide reductase heme-binding subunit YedZ